MKTDKLEDLLSAWVGHKDFAIWLVEYLKPKVTVDLGVDYGFSLFCLATPRIGTVYGIDSFEFDKHSGDHPDNYNVVMEFKEKHNFDNVVIIKGWFGEIAKLWSKPIDILHIDGLHTYEAITEDWNNWAKFVDDNGVIIMHDVISFPNSIGKFFNEINLPKMFFVESAGLGIVTKNEELIKSISQNFANCRFGNV